MKRALLVAVTLCAAVLLQAEDMKTDVWTHKNGVSTWHVEKALTVAGMDGFEASPEPETDQYGGWKSADLGATGFFRTQKVEGRWWIVTPEGHPYIIKGIAGFNSATSAGQRAKRDELFASKAEWLAKEGRYLTDNGFNSVGAWSDTPLIRDSGTPIPYCVIISPLKKFEGKLHPDAKLSQVAFVFDAGLEEAVEKAMTAAAAYKDDPWCVGYFIDNEIPWRNSLLEYYLEKLPKDDPNHVAAVKWMKKNKVKEIRPADREAFAAYVFDHYQAMAVKYLRKNDPNHMYLGCRFNMWTDELSNRKIFEAAGKYMDIISINHYNHWEPYWRRFENWERWSGKPEIVTEFYTKGEDSGMENKTGGGWVVHTQKDRGLFYQNFIINLLKSRSCVGWHWFKYQDNDPTNLKADPSNRNSNKGIVDNNFNHYDELVAEMKTVNDQVYNLISFLDRRPRKGCITLIDDDFRIGRVERYKEIMDSLGIRCTFAAVPNVKDGAEVFDGEKRNHIKFWQHEGYSFVLHPGHMGWYNNKKGTIKFASAEECAASLESSVAAYRKTTASNYRNFLVYPGNSGSNPEVVEMAGKYVEYGIGGQGIGKLNCGPVQIERLFINPDRPAEYFKNIIGERIARGEYVVLGTHSWEFDESNYGMLIDILSYCKTIAEFQTLQEGIGACL